MSWIRANVCDAAFIFSAFALGLTVVRMANNCFVPTPFLNHSFSYQVGMICAASGLAVLPKCRYGEPECYFRVVNCAYTGQCALRG